jgi:hypothetical protein
LLARACAIEGRNEAILVKVATERDLDLEALNDLGLFRQAVQRLRESIRDNVEVPFSSRGHAYAFFNELAGKVGLIVASSSRDKTPNPQSASRRIEKKALVRSPNFDQALERFTKAHPEYNDRHPDVKRSDC